MISSNIMVQYKKIEGKEENFNIDMDIYDYEVLDRANQFQSAVKVLKNLNKGIPLELNACLACELYLKYLVYFKKDHVDKKPVAHLKRVHDLKALYGECDDNTKIEIKKKMGMDFEDKLENVKENFKIVRYDYEFENVVYSPGFLINFMNVLSEMCNS